MSEVILDTITGKSTATTITIGSTPVVSASANSMTIRGEGSNQTSIQQGLSKAFCVFNGTGTVAISDSFNSTSLTDVTTGDYTLNVSNNMASVHYSISGSSVGSTVSDFYNMLVGDGASNTTSKYEIGFVHRTDSINQIDNDHASTVVHGDLA